MSPADVLGYKEVLGVAACCLSTVDQTSERRAVLEIASDAIVLVAFVDRPLEHVGPIDQCRPAVQEICMKTVARRITIGEDPGGSARGVEGEVLDVENELVEELHDLDRVAGRAITVTITVTIGRPCHVRFVVGRVKVYSIPAVREVDLSAHTIWAVVVEERIPLSPLRVALVSTGIVEADKADGIVFDVVTIEAAAGWIARYHAQTIGESANNIVLAMTR